MGLLTLASTSARASTSASQSNLGTAATIGGKIRLSGAMILSGSPSGSVVLQVRGVSAIRAQVAVAVAGGMAYVLVSGPAGADIVAAATASGNYSSGAQYDIRFQFGAAGRSVAVYTTGGTSVASGSDSGVTIANSGADNGYVRWGTTDGLGSVGAIDGVAVYSAAPPANGDAPRATDSGILWAVLDATVGQLVPGATDLDTLSGASWGAGGTWDPPAAEIEGDTEDGAESGDSASARLESARSLTNGAESGSVSAAARSTATATSAGAESGDSASAEVGKLAFVAETAESEAASTVTGTFHAGTTEGGESGDAHAAALTTAVATSEAAEAGDDQNAVIGGDVVWGFLGDSQTDEYQGTDDRGPPEVLNWMEILVERSRIFAGAWGTRSEPRRTGYEYNWARSGAQSPGVISDQLAGLAAQVAAGDVELAGYMSPGNDWLNLSGPLYAVTIYNGDGTEDSEGTPLTDIIATVVGWHQTIMDAIDAALDTAGSGGGMVVLTPQDYLASPPGIEAFPDATRRGWVTGVVEAIHSAVVAYAAGLNSAAGYTRFSVVRGDEYLLPVWATANGTYVTISGAQVDYTEGWEYDPETYDPYKLILASSPTGLAHAGTLMGGEYARAFIDGANQLTGVSIPPLSNSEILAIAGIPVGETVEGAAAGESSAASAMAAAGHSEGGEADESATAAVVASRAVTSAAESGEAAEAALETAAATTDAAEGADAHAAGRVTLASTTDGAESGETPTGVTGEASGTVTSGAESADLHLAAITTAAATNEGAESGATTDGQTGNVSHVTDRAESGEGITAILTGLAAVTDESEAGDGHAGGVLRAGSVAEGTEAGDATDAAVGNFSFVAEEAESDDVQAAIAELLGSLPEPAEAGDSWGVTVIAAAGVAEGAISGDRYVYPPDALPPYRASLTLASRQASLTVTSRRASLTVEDA